MAGRFLVLPAFRKPITALEDYKGDHDSYPTHGKTLVRFNQLLPYSYPRVSTAFTYHGRMVEADIAAV